MCFAATTRILGVIPTPSISHQLVFRPLWKHLSLRGHQVVVLTTDPVKDPALQNLKEMDLHFAYDVINRVHNLSNIFNEFTGKPLQMMHAIITAFNDVCNVELQNVDVSNIIEDQDEYFDLVIIEILRPEMLAFGHRFNCPVIGVTSMDVPSVVYESLGNPINSITNPDFRLALAGKLTFKERIVSVIFDLVATTYVYFHVKALSDNTIQKHFGNYPTINELISKIDMLFINVHPAFHGVRPLCPNIITIGSGLHLQHPKPLPQVIINQ